MHGLIAGMTCQLVAGANLSISMQAGEAEQHGGGATGACGGVEQPP